jgi:nitroimidazol reductase NimA-like FMN-containing flavoprotein (pyridoxamine 5'-phosphate oxidase superfamily)
VAVPAEPADVEVLDRDECLRLVATVPVGRVAVAVPGEPPLVVPVNFLLADGGIVFRTDYGTVFREGVVAGRPVSFQVDAVDVATHTGWSVLVGARATALDEWDSGSLSLRPWATGPKDRWIRLEPLSVTGRRLVLPELAGWPSREGYA